MFLKTLRLCFFFIKKIRINLCLNNSFITDQQIDESTFLILTEFVVKELFEGDPIGHRVKFFDQLQKLKEEKTMMETVSN